MGDVHQISAKGANARGGITTALLILVLLKKHHPRAISTYELGLWIQDNHQPPRPLSVVVKTLYDDGCIVRRAYAGKRAGLWALSERGHESLAHRVAQRSAAEEWLNSHPNYSGQEEAVMESLLSEPEQTPQRLMANCKLDLSPVRTALKRLGLRSFVERTNLIYTGYVLTPEGQRVAEFLRDQRAAA